MTTPAEKPPIKRDLLAANDFTPLMAIRPKRGVVSARCSCTNYLPAHPKTTPLMAVLDQNPLILTKYPPENPHNSETAIRGVVLPYYHHKWFAYPILYSHVEFSEISPYL